MLTTHSNTPFGPKLKTCKHESIIKPVHFDTFGKTSSLENLKGHEANIQKNCEAKIQEFSYASFPHIFNAIRLLEKILETKNDFFFLFKKKRFLGGLGLSIVK